MLLEQRGTLCGDVRQERVRLTSFVSQRSD